MKNATRFQVLTVGSVVLLGVTAGCATKKHVRSVVAPIEERLGKTEKQQAEDRAAIDELETGVSRADERAQEAGRQATQASQEALKASQQAQAADQSAQTAGRQAQTAQTRADEGITRVGNVERALGNLGNYRMVTDASILFGFNRSELNDEAKAKLDTLAGQFSGLGNYVIEVEGFTDQSGPMQYNLELGRRRAAAVVRYLTLHHQVPLRRIHVLGIGEEGPVADNKTRDGRKQNRRVELKVYSQDLSTAASKGQLESRVSPSSH
jgi:outer membrane protein OmpA-like peptidoglycan-associated protein